MLVFHMPAQKLSPEIVQAAIEGFEAQKSRIDAQIAQLRQMLDGDRPEAAAPSPAPQKRKRRLSAAGRKAIAEAARKRWAAIRAKNAEPSPASSKKTPRKNSTAKG